MTVLAVQPTEDTYTGDDVTTDFAFTFMAFYSDELIVTIDDVAQTYNVDYTITGLGDYGGGTVRFITAPANGEAISLSWDIDTTRRIDYSQVGRFLGDTVNQDMNRIWMRFQQLDAGGPFASLDVTGNATVGGTLTVTGNTALNANLTLGGSSKVISAVGDLEFSDAIQFDNNVYGMFSASGATTTYTFGDYDEECYFRFSASSKDISIKANTYNVFYTTADTLTTMANGTIEFTLDTAKGTCTGDLNVASGKVYKVNNVQVVGSRQTGWTPATGTHNRGAYASYDGQTISNPPTQAEVQALDDAVKALSRRTYSMETDITAHGLFGA